MSINRGMDKEDIVHIYNGILLSHEKEQNNPICCNLEILILSEVSQTEKDKYMISLICGILKKATNELIYKAEILLQM